MLRMLWKQNLTLNLSLFWTIPTSYIASSTHNSKPQRHRRLTTTTDEEEEEGTLRRWCWRECDEKKNRWWATEQRKSGKIVLGCVRACVYRLLCLILAWFCLPSFFHFIMKWMYFYVADSRGKSILKHRKY